MHITKFETNYKRKLFFSRLDNVKFKEYSTKIENQVINIYPEIKYQSIIGFGGAFTEATGVALKLLPENKQQELMNEYFSKDGFNYNLCRVSIGSSDFSEGSYSYSKKDDLSDFSIDKDRKYIIPAIKYAQKIIKMQTKN